MNCKYELAWIGECKEEANESGFCSTHEKEKCSCGKQAVGQCEEATSMVCGRPKCKKTLPCHYHQREDSIVW